MKRLLILVLVVLMGVLAMGGVTSAASRRVPFGFFGVVVDPPFFSDNPPSVIDSQMALMAKSGVESVRTNFIWESAEPAPGVYDWGPTDSIVSAAATHGLQLLPVVEFTPQWASSHRSNPNFDEYAPAHPSTFAAFTTALVDRYGPRGSFWAENPQVPREPIRVWQIWNEPAGTKYDWRSTPWQSTYAALLKAGYKAIHRADRGAVVVSGAVAALSSTLTQWSEMRDLYQAGAKGYFDVLAVTAFTNPLTVSASIDRSIEIVDRVRQVMRAHGDGAKPIWVTEFTWTAAAGLLPEADYYGFETSPKGQAERLTAYYERIASTHTEGIERAFWYTWWSPYVPQEELGNVPTFQYSGLLKWQPGQPFKPLPVLSAYARVAGKFEGCRKTANARTCS